jgi:hypothetical protein
VRISAAIEQNRTLLQRDQCDDAAVRANVHRGPSGDVADAPNLQRIAARTRHHEVKFAVRVDPLLGPVLEEANPRVRDSRVWIDSEDATADR